MCYPKNVNIKFRVKCEPESRATKLIQDCVAKIYKRKGVSDMLEKLTGKRGKGFILGITALMSVAGGTVPSHHVFANNSGDSAVMEQTEQMEELADLLISTTREPDLKFPIINPEVFDTREAFKAYDKRIYETPAIPQLILGPSTTITIKGSNHIPKGREMIGNVIHEGAMPLTHEMYQEAIGNLRNELKLISQNPFYSNHLTAPISFDLAGLLIQHSIKNNIPSEEKKANLDESIKCLERVLLTRTKENNPEDYADIMQNMGIAYRELSKFGNKEENLKLAIQCHKESLGIFEKLPPLYGEFRSLFSRYNLGLDYEAIGNKKEANKYAAAYNFKAWETEAQSNDKYYISPWNFIKEPQFDVSKEIFQSGEIGSFLSRIQDPTTKPAQTIFIVVDSGIPKVIKELKKDPKKTNVLIALSQKWKQELYQVTRSGETPETLAALKKELYPLIAKAAAVGSIDAAIAQVKGDSSISAIPGYHGSEAMRDFNYLTPQLIKATMSDTGKANSTYNKLKGVVNTKLAYLDEMMQDHVDAGYYRTLREDIIFAAYGAGTITGTLH